MGRATMQGSMHAVRTATISVLLGTMIAATALAQPASEEPTDVPAPPAPVFGPPVAVGERDAVPAQDEPETGEVLDEMEDGGSPYFDMSLEELLEVKAGPSFGFSLYGFLRSNLEQVYHIPDLDEDGNTVYGNGPLTWSIPQFHLYGSADLNDRFSLLFNLALIDGDLLELRNAWGNVRIFDELQIRTGKMYNQFGLFNWKLDQTPTFIGIEPPELFDEDHLLVPRTLLAAVHGRIEPTSEIGLEYTLQTGNNEGGPKNVVFPVGWDLRLRGKGVVIGTSGFASSPGGRRATSTVAVGEGSPRGGVLPWMRGDSYIVTGAFLETTVASVLIQAAYWHAIHNATRNLASVMTLVDEAGINESQQARFLDEDGRVIEDVRYKVQTAYVRLGRTSYTRIGSLTPYAHLDWMSHPEVIRNLQYGGDEEAGLADDGVFWKPSLGVVYNPLQSVAFKGDVSVHVQQFNGQTTTYPEWRLDASYAFTAFDYRR